MKLKYRSAEAYAPATVSNIGCGFDILGFAINGLGDRVRVTLRGDRDVVIKQITNNPNLPFSPEENTAGKAIITFMEAINADFGVDIIISKDMPIGSGLGSSAASSVAGVVAVNHLLDSPLSRHDILKFALEGEAVASGGMHGDNVIPSLFGGFNLIYDPENFHFTRIQAPDDLFSVVVHPDVQIKTSYARSLLPKEIPLKTVIKQMGVLGKLIAGLTTGNYDLISGSIVDWIAEPVRAELIPYYQEIKKTAFKHNALGCNISGSGPSVFSIFRGNDMVNHFLSDLSELFEEKKLKGTFYPSFINNQGAEIIFCDEILQY